MGLAGFLAAGVSVDAAPVNSVFNPNDYASNGTLTLTSGSIAFTTSGTTPTYSINGGAAVSGTTGSSASGNVEMAIFNFDSISIGSGVAVTVTGTRGLVLASKGSFSFGSILRLDGTNASSSIGLGAPGAEGGVAGTSFSSAPPPSTRGNGGNDFQDGVGFGGSKSNTNTTLNNSASGASYGGVGGVGNNSTGLPPGATYGTADLINLFGGSGGAGSQKQGGATESWPGGGGGGALEFTALGPLTITGTISARGGSGSGDGSGNDQGGGGGSGGGILLNAPSIDLVTGALVEVTGGVGGTTSLANRGGGGGGGGRIAFYTDALTDSSGIIPGGATPAGVTTAGGLGGTNAPTGSAGAAGTYFRDAVVVPEPTGLALLAVGSLVALRRRRRALSCR